MKLLILLSVLAVSISAIEDIKSEFALFKQKHNKTYKTLEEEAHSFENYVKNKIGILKHNLLYLQGKAQYTQAINKFSDLSFEEFAAIYLININPNDSKRTPDEIVEYNPMEDIPDAIDWREKGLVTPVKNQGGCGSCWTFSATGTLEGAYKKSKGDLVSWSEQQLVDCDRTPNDEGCKGGFMKDALEYIQKNNISTEKDYPYEGVDGKCRVPSSGLKTGLKKIVGVKVGDENALKQTVAKYGPVSVGIYASDAFENYSGNGVLEDSTCNDAQMNHGVLVVGYGSDNGTDFWLVKNSWGADWGAHGYIKMSRNKSNQCHIADYAFVPVV